MTLTILTGCGLLQKSDDRPLPAGAFRGTAAIRSQTVPLPVEIANDIARISETGEVIRVNEVPSSASQQPAVASEILAPVNPEQDMQVQADNELNIQENAQTDHPLTGRQKFSGRATASEGGETIQYTIQSGDTLMKIAFEKYGNVYRWREIYNSNRDLIKDYNLIYVGDILTIHGVQYLVLEKNGQPYLIRKGDTLKSISQKLYGTPDKWRELLNNNAQLIRNPRGIYAGFTIYYQPSSSPVEELPQRTPANK